MEVTFGKVNGTPLTMVEISLPRNAVFVQFFFWNASRKSNIILSTLPRSSTGFPERAISSTGLNLSLRILFSDCGAEYTKSASADANVTTVLSLKANPANP